MPRGAIQPMKARSRPVKSVLRVDSSAITGLTSRTSAATSTTVGSSTGTSDSGVTEAEMATNSRPMISWISVSKNGRRTGMSKPGRFAATRPMTIAAMSPVSSYTASQHAATTTTTANWASVPRVSPRRSSRRVSHSSTAPTTPPASPTAMLPRNEPTRK